MLFTRCPDCDTTFRVTDDALAKANGQVRCGRCASVFNAYAERQDPPPEAAAEPASALDPGARDEAAGVAPDSTPPAKSAALPSVKILQPAQLLGHEALEPEALVAAATAASKAHDAAVSLSAAGNAAVAVAPEHVAKQAPELETEGRTERAADLEPMAEIGAHAEPGTQVEREKRVEPVADLRAELLGNGDLVADVAADVTAKASAAGGARGLESAAANDGAAADDAGAEASDDLASVPDPLARTDAISASQVNEVLEAEDPSLRTWRDFAGLSAAGSRARGWLAGSAVAVVALGAQALHHYRGDLATHESIGPIVQSAYGIFGATLVPNWDVAQYEIVDWIATADQDAGALRITARIKNDGPTSQPYPSVHLQLKDRWEATVGSRVFAPSEYLTAAPRKLMSPGETTRAELEIVDPGQNAYGFELDVCIEIETRALSCGRDKVFR